MIPDLQCKGVKWIRSVSPENSKVFTSCGCDYFDSDWCDAVAGSDNIPARVSLFVFKWFRSERDGGGADTPAGPLHCDQQRAASSLRGSCWCRVAGCSCIRKYCLLLPLWHSSRSPFGLQAWHGCSCESSSSPSFHYLLLLFIVLDGVMDFLSRVISGYLVWNAVRDSLTNFCSILHGLQNWLE